MTSKPLDVVDLTSCRDGSGKRPASPTAEVPYGRQQKRTKDNANEEILQSRIVTAAAPLKTTKRPLEEDAPDVRGDQGSRGAGHADVTRVLQSSDLENSIASISGALRWRSPVKPYKLPRLHGPLLPGAPTAVLGIVDVGDPDEEGGRQQQHAADHQHCPTAAGANGPQQQPQPGATATDRGHQGGQAPPPVPAAAQAAQERYQDHRQQQHEWGRLFSALSLGGRGRGSQRTDPVWAAATSNRAAGGSSGLVRGAVGPTPGPVPPNGRGQATSSSSGGGCGGQTPAKAQQCSSSPTEADRSRSRARAEAMNAEECSHAPTWVPGIVAAPSWGSARGELHALQGGYGAAALGAVPGAPSGGALPGSAVCEAMEAGPAKTAGGPMEAVRGAAPSADRPMRREPPVRHRGSGGGAGGFLAQEAWRLLAGSGADRT